MFNCPPASNQIHAWFVTPLAPSTATNGRKPRREGHGTYHLTLPSQDYKHPAHGVCNGADPHVMKIQVRFNPTQFAPQSSRNDLLTTLKRCCNKRQQNFCGTTPGEQQLKTHIRTVSFGVWLLRRFAPGDGIGGVGGS